LEIYEIYYNVNNKTEQVECTGLSLKQMIKRIEKEQGKVIEIKRRKNKTVQSDTSIRKLEKDKFYRSIYNNMYSKLKNGEITETEFRTILKEAKKIKADSLGKNEFEYRYRKYICEKEGKEFIVE